MDGASNRGNWGGAYSEGADQFSPPSYDLNIDGGIDGQEASRMDPLLNRRMSRRQSGASVFPSFHQGAASSQYPQFAYPPFQPQFTPHMQMHASGGYMQMLHGGDIHNVGSPSPPRPYIMSSPPPGPTRTPGSDSSKKSSRRSEDTDASVSSPRKKSKVKDKTAQQNKVWQNDYDLDLIPILAKLGRDDNLKSDKGFKMSAWNISAKRINEIHKTEFTGDNVKNHYQTIRNRLKEVKACFDISGAGWNEAERMITLGQQSYEDYISAHPRAKNYINKSMPWYDDLVYVCGDDDVKGDTVKTIFNTFPLNTNQSAGGEGDNANIDTPYAPGESDDGYDAMPTQHATDYIPIGSSHSTPPSVGKKKPRRRSGGEVIEAATIIATQVEKVVGALYDALNKPHYNWYNDLAEKVYAFEKYPHDVLDKLFTELTMDKKVARRFIAVPNHTKKKMLEEKIQLMAAEEQSSQRNSG